MIIKKILFILFCAFTTLSIAQSYNFSKLTGTYTNLANSTSLNNNVPWDDPELTIPIGFNFQYFNSTLSELTLFSDGDGADLSTQTTPTGTLPILIAYGVDIIDRGYDFNNPNANTGSLSNISYKLEGTVGSRILKIEWKNVGFYEDINDDGISIDYTNFQLWLFEGINTIEIHFGPNSITQPNLNFEGETGARIGLVENYNFNTETLIGTAKMLNGDPNAPFLVNSNDDTLESIYLNGVIPNGTIYRFENQNLSINNFELDKTTSLFPNPSKEYFKLTTNSNTINSISIINTSGLIIKTIHNPKSKIDVSYLSSGIYFIKINTKLGSVSKKLIKL
ncbi:T9SS type A sorting domain-containing protein [uncultured Lacinutrix sp.]|uniref:T9SS type A sorting domain-containing protein n=1 Tax=uncultured Lacinutrix sp. TaxID=574032 RepID=UPI0026397ECF|nr:T9SS type A sorting domain-containing protein [uncultured Lacinutrix sp.]